MGLIPRPESVEVPHEPGSHVLLKRLSGHEMDEARARTRAKAVALLKDMPGDQLREAVAAAARAPAGDVVQAQAKLDPDALVEFGLVGWNGPAFMDEGQLVPCNADTKRDRLDDATRQWVVVELTKRNARP